MTRETVTGFDLYLPAGKRMVLYHAADASFDGTAERRLRGSVPAEFYIRASDRDALRRYLQQHLRASLASTDPPHERAQLLFAAACDALDALAADPDEPALLHAAADIAVLSMEQVIGETRVLGAFIALGQVGTQVYRHAVQCCFLASALGHRIGLPIDALRAVAVAGLLHDVGHARLDPELMRRPERSYSEVERSMFRRHPVLGAEILARGDLPYAAAEFVRQHHERPDGEGYPAGVVGEALSVGGRITAIVDAYDRLRYPQWGEHPHNAFHALASMRFRSAGGFDAGLLTEFVHLLGSVEPEPAETRAGPDAKSRAFGRASRRVAGIRAVSSGSPA